MESREPDQTALRASLRAAKHTETTAAQASKAPLWFYACSGVLLAALSLVVSLGTPIWIVVGGLAALAVGRLLYSIRRSASGSTVGGLRSGRASLWTYALLLVILGLMVLGRFITVGSSNLLLPVLIAVVVFIATIAYGAIYERSRGHVHR